MGNRIEPELLPCPFCGGEKARTIHIRDGRKVACPCGACGKPCFNGPADMPDADARAITAWNTRANTHPLLVEALEKTVAALRSAYQIPSHADDDRIYDEMGSDVSGAYFAARQALASAQVQS